MFIADQDKQKEIDEVCRKLFIYKWRELQDMGISPYQIKKIKAGERVYLRDKTINRLKAALKIGD